MELTPVYNVDNSVENPIKSHFFHKIDTHIHKSMWIMWMKKSGKNLNGQREKNGFLMQLCKLFE